jgi:glycosyltransferase involved in cell wall biosynthesis
MKNQSTNSIISIITVNYNSAGDLEKTVDSIIPLIEQLNIEFILIDGLSTDDSLTRLGSKRNIFTKIVSEKDSGIYDAMNKGIYASKSKWIWFVNAGDKVLINPTELLEFLIKSDGNFIYSDYIANSKHYIKQNLTVFSLYSRMLNHQSIIYSSDFIGVFDLSYGLGADYANLLKNIKILRPNKINSALIDYDLKGKSSEFGRFKRFKIWIQRARAMLNSSLPWYHKLLGAIFCTFVASIKIISPNFYSRIGRLRNDI